MVLPRSSNCSSIFRVQGCRTARAVGQSWRQTGRQAGRRSYASGHHEGAKKASSDLPWYAPIYRLPPIFHHHSILALHERSPKCIAAALITSQANRIRCCHCTISDVALATRPEEE